ncbi:unnamed protein product [Notodromas monacha]|uniref:Dynein intermediate chain 3, ciliary n=1 Tax=Notodromas monacha TaxID=399045 RepID=A0A7R9BW51_9CRUS|nr:unnamed protein product [Notodromas monacha]CAG0921217.1 unnamed protein product [Notodromas monacha]
MPDAYIGKEYTYCTWTDKLAATPDGAKAQPSIEASTAGQEVTPSAAAAAPARHPNKLQTLVRTQSTLMFWSRVRGGLPPQRGKSGRGVRLSELADMMDSGGGGGAGGGGAGNKPGCLMRRSVNLKATRPRTEIRIPPDENLLSQFVEKTPLDKAIQCSPSMSEHWVSTEHSEKHSQGVNHVEGGWPKDINAMEPDQTQRFRKKIEKEEGFVQTVKELGNVMTHCIMQNNAVDIYQDYFDTSSHVAVTESTGKLDTDSDSPSAKIVSTEHSEKHSQGVNHVEGGWPKDINAMEPDQTQRFRKKIEKEEGFVQTVKELGNVMTHCIMQNNAVDIYQDYFDTSSHVAVTESTGKLDTDSDSPSAKIVAVFKDFSETTAGACGMSGDKRSACKVSWSPDAGRKLAVAYAVVHFSGVKPDIAKESCVWDIDNVSNKLPLPPNMPCTSCPNIALASGFHLMCLVNTMPENANVPELVLESKTNLVALEFNPKDCNILAGGMDKGQVCWWDIRRGPVPVETTPVHVSHTEPVYSLTWINSKQGTEWFTAANDGKVSKVALCTRKAKNPAERILNVYGAHAGPVYAVQRNPSALKNFLTIGDWSAKIWAEDVRDSAIISTKAQPARLIDGCWNPTRPCTFYTANLNGVLDAWDILAYHSKPIFSLQVTFFFFFLELIFIHFNMMHSQVCDEGLQCIRVEESGHLLAAGSVEGNTYLIQVSESLNRMSKNERTLMTAVSNPILLLEREAHREKLLEQRVKEQRVRERSSGRVANNTPGTPGPNHEERFLMPMDHEAMEKAKKDYLSAVKATIFKL